MCRALLREVRHDNIITLLDVSAMYYAAFLCTYTGLFLCKHIWALVCIPRAPLCKMRQDIIITRTKEHDTHTKEHDTFTKEHDTRTKEPYTHTKVP